MEREALHKGIRVTYDGLNSHDNRRQETMKQNR